MNSLPDMDSDHPDFPNHLVTGLLELVRSLEQFQLRYALIGGLATSYRSRPRFTQDLDFLLDAPQLVWPCLLKDLLDRGFSCDLEVAIREWVQHHMAVLSFRGVRIDLLKPVLPVFQHMLESARTEQWLGLSVRVATTESLILCKLLSFRTQDQIDIENLLAANRGQLDLDFIRREWLTVADHDDPRMRRFEEMVAQC